MNEPKPTSTEKPSTPVRSRKDKKTTKKRRLSTPNKESEEQKNATPKRS
jgi:hypothetical protein